MDSELVRILSKENAAKLADLYLPVHLRDWYLSLHPLIQCNLYDISSSAEDFFTCVCMEHARHMNKTKYKVMPWKNKIVPDEVQLNTLEFNPILRLTNT